MIGEKSDKIVIGYEFPVAYDREPWKSKLPAKVAEAVKAFQAAAVLALVELRKSERAQKDALEDGKNTKMQSNDTDKHEYLWETYVPQLRRIGITQDKAALALLDAWTKLKLALEGGWSAATVEVLGSEYSYVLRHAAVAGDLYVLQLLQGASGYVERDTTTPRTVFMKRLDLLADDPEFKAGDNQYVQDDRGVYTRRFGYAAKSYYACHQLYEDGTLTGRFQYKKASDKSVAAELRDPRKITKDLDYRFPTLKKKRQDGGAMTTEEMLFVHQELGSGDHQRGVCLSSSSKDAYGNQGDPFLKPGESVLIKVDLAKVPTGQDLLYNLYSQDAQTKTAGVKNKSTASGHMLTATKAKTHTDTSTAKNRESYLRYLTLDQVVNQDEVKAAWEEQVRRTTPVTPPVTASPTTVGGTT